MALAASDNGLTPQQKHAVELSGTSVVLTAVAGCGKTTVLTQRYLKHLVSDGASVGQIVAITFTEKAAREMRQRIRKAVLQRLDNATSDSETATWEKHLRDLESAQISTIHAFCTAILRQHAREAGLDSRFEVLEDYMAQSLKREAVAESLQKLLTSQSSVGADLRELVPLFGWEPTLTGVGRLLDWRDQDDMQKWLQRPPDDIAKEWRRIAREVVLPRYLEYLIAASPKIAGCLWLLETTPCIGPKMQANIALIFEKLPELANAPDLADAVSEVREAAKVGGERAKAWRCEEDYENIKTALAGFRDELPKKLALFTEEPEDLGTTAEIGRRFLRVAIEAGREYERVKSRNDRLDFDDLLVKTRGLLRENEAVRNRLHDRFWFVLIDELQDTDEIQMQLVELLTGEGLKHGKLFAVGDPSQSIYRFRGANVQKFKELKRAMPEAGRLELTVNFRSQPQILHFVNALVGKPAGAGRSLVRNAGLEDFTHLQPHRQQVTPGPCVEFLWTPRTEKDTERDASADDDEETDSARGARKAEAATIARRIATMIRSGEELVAAGPRLRPVTAADVVLLFRAMSNVELYETALRGEDLDYYLVGGRAYFAQQEIYDLLNLLRALENPQDSLSLVGTLRAPFCCLSDEALFVLCRHKDGPWAGLHDPRTRDAMPPSQQSRAERAARFLDGWRAVKDRLPIAGLINRVFADSGYDAAMQFEPLGDRKLANLWKLVDIARSFDRSGLFGLADFIARLGELVRSQPREEQAATQPEKADVVRLMTIHQAKGLEFPVVFVVDMSAKTGFHRLPVAHWDAALGCVAKPPAEEPPLFSDFPWQCWKAGEAVAEWREELRKLYVACTRAEDYLVLSAAVRPDYRPEGAWMRLLAERFDLRSGECRATGQPKDQVPKVRIK